MAAAAMKLTAAKCPSCRVILLRPVPGSSCQMSCPACNYLTSCSPSRPPRPPTLLPTVEVTDTSQKPRGNFPPNASTSNHGLLVHESHLSLHRGQDTRDYPAQPVDMCSPCSSSDDSNTSPTQPSPWLPLPPPFPLGMGSIRRHSYQLIENQSASTPSR